LNIALLWTWFQPKWRIAVAVGIGSVLFQALESSVQKEIQVLQKELAKTREQIAKLQASLQEKPDYGMGKGDPAIVRWELDQAILEQSKERATSLEQALARLQQGTYGTCERCGQPIHPDRLTVLPETKLCIACARNEN
jgi:RNA polymerase-binding transcription factor DksA